MVRVPFSGASAKVTAGAPARVEIAEGEAVIRFAAPVQLNAGKKLKLSLA